MVRTWLKQLSKKWSSCGGVARKASRPPVRLGVEALEVRDTPSSLGQGPVPSALQLRTDGQLVFSDPARILSQPWSGGINHSGALYSANGHWATNNGDFFYKYNDPNNTLYDKHANGVTVVVATNVQDFTVGKDGGLWVLKTGGAVDKQTGTSGYNIVLTRVGADTYNFLTTNYDGNGDVWAITSEGGLTDFTKGVITSFSGWSGVDIAFNSSGTLYAYLGRTTTSTTGGNFLEWNGSAWLVLETNATLIADWRNTAGYGAGGHDFGYDYWNPATDTTALKFAPGDEYHGMLIG